MYVDSSSITVNQKTYTRHLLRTSFRKDGKVKHRTIANISSCSDEEIQAVKLGLKYKGNLAELASLDKSMKLQQGLRVGAVWVLLCLAKQLHIVDALGAGRQAKLALWQIMARIIEHSSRLSAVRLARSHAVCDLLDLDSFNEDDLYANLDWLHENQSKIEDRLFRATHQDSSPTLFLYDVTSSYLEGTHNDLGAFGYNRDGKSGKQQIVLGLLCDDQGVPLSIEVFPGNTSDTKTFASQVHKVAERFGGGEVTFVGDRGMIKGPQIQLLKEHEDNFHYISALTKPQIEGLLKKGILQMSLFDEAIAEVLSEEGGERFVVRRNPIRAEEMKRNRQDRLDSLNNRVEKYNAYLEEHPKAKVEVGLRRMKDNATRLKIHKWVEIEPRGTKRLFKSIRRNWQRLKNWMGVTPCGPTFLVPVQLEDDSPEDKIHTVKKGAVMSKPRRRHTAEQKAELLRQHVVEKKPSRRYATRQKSSRACSTHGKGSYWLERIRCFRPVARRAVS